MSQTEPIRSTLRNLATLATVAASFALLYVGRTVLAPLILAMLLSVLLSPLVRRLERLGIGRVASVLAAVSGVAAILIVIGWSATRQLIDLSLEMPQHRDTLVAKIRALRSQDYGFDEVQRVVDDVQREISGEGASPEEESGATEESPDSPSEASSDATPTNAMVRQPSPDARRDQAVRRQVEGERPEEPSGEKQDDAVAVKVVEMPPSPLQQVKNWLGPLVAPLTTIGLVAVLSVFMLIQQEDLRDRCIELLGANSIYTTTEALRRSSQYISRFVQTQFLVNALFGAAVAGGLYVLGVPNAMLWGALALLLRFLPYVGPWLAAAMPVLLSVAVFDDWRRPLLVIAYFVVLELAVNNILEPLAYGKTGGISALAVILATLFWLWIWGPVGLLVAMPITLCLIVLAEYVPTLRPLAILLRSRSGLSRHEQLYQRVLSGDRREIERIARSARSECDSAIEMIDRTILPALQLAENDRCASQMQEALEREVLETMAELAIEALKRDASRQVAKTANPRTVLCVPFGGAADEAAARMLGAVLATQGHVVQTRSLRSLANETLAEVEQCSPDVLVMSLLPPIDENDGKYLLKLLDASPSAPRVIEGRWAEDRGKATSTAARDGVDRIVRSFAECCNYIAQAPLARPQLLKQVSEDCERPNPGAELLDAARAKA